MRNVKTHNRVKFRGNRFSRGRPLTLIFEFIEEAANDLLHPQVLADDRASDDDAAIVNL